MTNPIWGSKRMAVLDSRQVKCTTFDEGSVWLHKLDNVDGWQILISTFARPVSTSIRAATGRRVSSSISRSLTQSSARSTGRSDATTASENCEAH